MFCIRISIFTAHSQFISSMTCGTNVYPKPKKFKPHGYTQPLQLFYFVPWALLYGRWLFLWVKGDWKVHIDQRTMRGNFVYLLVSRHVHIVFRLFFLKQDLFCLVARMIYQHYYMNANSICSFTCIGIINAWMENALGHYYYINACLIVLALALSHCYIKVCLLCMIWQWSMGSQTCSMWYIYLQNMTLSLKLQHFLHRFTYRIPSKWK